METNPARKTTLYVVKNSKDVKINKEKIRQTAKKWTSEKISIPEWPSGMHFRGKNDEQTLTYLILLDALNFCFWTKKSNTKRWEIKYKNKKYNGYFALSLALKKFFLKNPDKANFIYLKNISFPEFKKILQGGKNLQFLKKRWQITKKISVYITKKYGSSTNFVLSANHHLSKLIPRIANELYSFKDETKWQGKKICTWKRAQILAIDILGTFNNKGAGHFRDLGYATAFADYKVPQILHTLGIIEYSPRLTRIIANKRLIKAFSREEIEIRAATIWAVEYLQKELKKHGKELYPFQIDWILWNKSQDRPFGKLRARKMALPYHLTKTYFY